MIIKPVCLTGFAAHLARVFACLLGAAIGAGFGTVAGYALGRIGFLYVDETVFEEGVTGITLGFALLLVGFAVALHWFEGCRCHCGNRFAFCVTLVLWRGERIPWLRPQRPYLLKAPQAYNLIPPEECP